MRFVACLGIMCVLQLTSVCLGRDWTDVSGTRHREAELIAVHGDTVVVLLPDGSVGRTLMGRLSEKDQAFVRKFAEVSEADARKDQRIVEPAKAPSEVLYAQHRAPEQSDVVLTSAHSDLPGDDGGPLVLLAQAGAPSAPSAKALNAAGTDDVHLVYTGKIGTFHLFGNTGSGLFWYAEPFVMAEQYFVQLQPVKSDPSRWLYYKPVNGGAPFATQFAFDRNPTYGLGYAVWVLDLRNSWHLFEYAHRQPRGDYWPPGF